LEEIGPQVQPFRIIDRDCTWCRQDDDRAIKQLRPAKIDQQVVRLVLRVEADVRLGQLGEADREVDVGARIVGAPAPIPAVGRLPVDDAAVMEAAVEILRLGNVSGAEAEEAAAAELRVRHRRGDKTYRGDSTRTEKSGRLF